MFAENKTELKEREDARKNQIGADAAWERISRYKKVLIGKGKKIVEYNPETADKKEVLKAALGRSGNLRAPAIDLGDRLIIGFNEELYKDLD